MFSNSFQKIPSPLAEKSYFLIVDEALAVGDESFQRKCFTRIRDIQERGGTILFVSHSDATIIELCNKAILLDKGELLCSGDPKAVISNYHKLLYAPDDKKESIRADLKTGVLFSDPCKTKKTDKTNDTSNNDADQHHFDDQLTPETMVSYESNGAQIRDPHITNMDGKRTNLLHPNETYLYKYTVTFINDAKSVKELDKNLRTFDQTDPVKYDFALFGLGVFEKF